jgi:hypothetical protein
LRRAAVEVSTRRGLALTAVLVTALVAGCGSQHDSQRPAVASYVKQVNTIESALVNPLGAVTSAASQFSSEQSPSKSTTAGLPSSSPERTLEQAWTRVLALRARLAAIKAPPAAQHLRTLLLELIDGQAAMTHEVGELVAFLPQYNAALASLGPAIRRLERALSRRSAYGAAAVQAVYHDKAAALLRFQGETGTVLHELRRLAPPAVSQPGYAAQLASVKGMGLSAGQLAAVLDSGAPSNVQPLLVQFDRAAARSSTVAVQKAEIAAIRAYDSRSTALDDLSQKVTLERLRLSNTLR